MTHLLTAIRLNAMFLIPNTRRNEKREFDFVLYVENVSNNDTDSNL